MRGLLLVEGVHPPFERDYLPPLFLPALLSVPGPTLPCPDGLRALPLLEPAIPLFIPVVVPAFILEWVLEWVAPGPTLPSLDAPGAGCVCADALAVAPSREASAIAEIASLVRIREHSLDSYDAGIKTRIIQSRSLKARLDQADVEPASAITPR